MTEFFTPLTEEKNHMSGFSRKQQLAYAAVLSQLWKGNLVTE
jgi:hypothetical protein